MLDLPVAVLIRRARLPELLCLSRVDVSPERRSSEHVLVPNVCPVRGEQERDVVMVIHDGLIGLGLGLGIG